MEIWLIKDERGHFHPFGDEDGDKAARIPVMEENLFTVKRIRNPRMHRKYFALLRIAFDNQEDFESSEHMRIYLQMKVGYYDRVATKKGHAYLPKSIAFDKMDQSEFEQLFEKVLARIVKEWGFDVETLRNESEVGST